MKTLRSFVAALFLAAAASAADPAPPLTVFAAASLADVLREAGARYEKESGTPVRFSFDSSGTLARQIQNGAPADLFVSANREWMDLLSTNALVDSATRRVLARNQLVVVRPRDGAFTLAQPGDLAYVRRLAIGDPASVPAGLYARQFLETRGLWTGLQERLVFAANARAVLALVERGDADAGLAYSTDVRAAPDVLVCFTVDAADHEAIAYEIAVVQAAPRQVAALKFLWQLESPEVQEMFRQHGFTLP